MNNKPRVLFVDNNVESFVSLRMPLARAACAVGYEVHVACPPGCAAEQLKSEGFAVHLVALDRRSVNPFRELNTIAALYRVYKRVRPDIVHHMRLKPVLYGGLAARLARVPAVVNLLTGLGYLFVSSSLTARCLRPLVMSASRVAFSHPNQRVIFQNPDDSRVFIRSGALLPTQASLIMGSGVDPELFSPRAVRPGPAVVLLASRMLWDKGIAEFVKAAGILRNSGLNARFVLVGDTDLGNPSSIPAERLREWEETGEVEWWGRRTDMPNVLNEAHIVCLPSLREGLPRILIEAASCGRPLVATDVPGCREIVRNGDNGLLVPPRDARSLARALRVLLEDASLRQSMGARGRERVLREFCMTIIVSKFMDVYGLLLGTRASPPPISEAVSHLRKIVPPGGIFSAE